jgi:hypothetical protein
MRAMRMTLAMVGLVLGLVGGASSAANATTYVGNCSVTANSPAGVYLATNGQRISAGRVSTSCTTVRPVRVEVQLWGSDVASNDYLGGYTYWNDADGYTSLLRGNWAYCNEDIGTDEVFSRARVGVPIGNGQYAWSAWDRGPVVNYSC